jgi:hypothetical protein
MRAHTQKGIRNERKKHPIRRNSSNWFFALKANNPVDRAGNKTDTLALVKGWQLSKAGKDRPPLNWLAVRRSTRMG